MQATTINMAQALLDRGAELWEQDRYEEATRVLSRLLGLRVVAPSIAERAQFLLGDIQLGRGHYMKARRHLAAALATGTDSGETHFLMACALDWDDEPDPPRAFYHYRRAVELEPGQPLYSSAYALMRIRRKNGSKYDRESLRRLRDAFAAIPDDQDVVYNYASGLMQMGRHDEAEIAICRARKRWPNHPAFEELWFELMSELGRLNKAPRGSFISPRLRVVPDEPLILKFPVAPATTNEPTARPARLARPLSTRARLKTALATLSDAEVHSLAERLEIRCEDGGRLRARVAGALLEPGRLESIIRSLSTGSRHLIQVISNDGGRTAIKELRLRVDAAADTRGPHFARRRAAVQPLDELQQFGLVFLTSDTSQQAQPDVVMIPTDLRKRLREVMAAAQ